jgi:uncharacterized membrane protein YgcG
MRSQKGTAETAAPSNEIDVKDSSSSSSLAARQEGGDGEGTSSKGNLVTEDKSEERGEGGGADVKEFGVKMMDTTKVNQNQGEKEERDEREEEEEEEEEEEVVVDPVACHVCFWVNLYHALLQHALLLLGPPRSPRDWASFHSSVSYELFGNVFSLLEIEHCVLRNANHGDGGGGGGSDGGSGGSSDGGSCGGVGGTSSSYSSSSPRSNAANANSTNSSSSVGGGSGSSSSSSSGSGAQQGSSPLTNQLYHLPKHYPKLPSADDERRAFCIARLVRQSELAAAAALSQRQRMVAASSSSATAPPPLLPAASTTTTTPASTTTTTRSSTSTSTSLAETLFPHSGCSWDPRLNFVLHNGSVGPAGAGVVVLTPASLLRVLNERTSWCLEHTGGMLADPASKTLGPLPRQFEMFPGDFRHLGTGLDSLGGGDGGSGGGGGSSHQQNITKSLGVSFLKTASATTAAAAAARGGGNAGAIMSASAHSNRSGGGSGSDGGSGSGGGSAGGSKAAAAASLQRKRVGDLARFCLRHVGHREQWKRLSLLLLEVDDRSGGGAFKVTYAPMRFVSYDSLVDTTTTTTT